MKKLTLILFTVLITSCASSFKERKSTGVSCAPMVDKENTKSCVRIDSYSDPLKHWDLRPWEGLPDTPDMP